MLQRAGVAAECLQNTKTCTVMKLFQLIAAIPFLKMFIKTKYTDTFLVLGNYSTDKEKVLLFFDELYDNMYIQYK